MNPEGCAHLRPAPWRGAARQCAAGKCITCCADCSQREGYESKARNAVTGEPYKVAPCNSPMRCDGPRGTGRATQGPGQKPPAAEQAKKPAKRRETEAPARPAPAKADRAAATGEQPGLF